MSVRMANDDHHQTGGAQHFADTAGIGQVIQNTADRRRLSNPAIADQRFQLNKNSGCLTTIARAELDHRQPDISVDRRGRQMDDRRDFLVKRPDADLLLGSINTEKQYPICCFSRHHGMGARNYVRQIRYPSAGHPCRQPHDAAGPADLPDRHQSDGGMGLRHVRRLGCSATPISGLLRRPERRADQHGPWPHPDRWRSPRGAPAISPMSWETWFPGRMTSTYPETGATFRPCRRHRRAGPRHRCDGHRQRAGAEGSRTGRLAADDPQRGYDRRFPAVGAGPVIRDGEQPALGNTIVTARAPRTYDGQHELELACLESTWRKAVVFAASLNLVSTDDYRFSAASNKAVIAAFARGRAAMRELPRDILITAHADQDGATGRFLTAPRLPPLCLVIAAEARPAPK
ncbi:unnamed protein product [Acanthosepion pharaonis]|uniref:Uncharacterized protein n=1 Tax=Acanthosepion pharaonis TaxID=158019 RepID=A0A812DCF2_ACAPH|nr:unnamed protein product [Sepia pharaonis]